MFRKNSLLVGLAIGIVVPILGFVLIDSLLGVLGSFGIVGGDGEGIRFKQRTMALLAICTNLLPFYRYNTRFTEATMRGVLLATGIWVAVWFFKFGLGLLSGNLD